MKLSKLRENSERQFNKIIKKIHCQNETFSKEIESIRKEPNRNSGAGELIEWNKMFSKEHLQSSGENGKQNKWAKRQEFGEGETVENNKSI